MKLVKTVRCKMVASREQAEALKETMLKFSQACNEALDVALEKGITHPYGLHRELYRPLKARYGLTANYVVRVFPRVVGAIKAAKRKGHRPKLFRPKSLPLDKDLFRMKEWTEGTLRKFRVSVSTAQGREKFDLDIGGYQEALLTGQRPKAATVSYDKRKRAWYINITLSEEREMPRPRPDAKIVGVDLGIANLATTSTGMRFSGKQAMHIRREFKEKRAALSAKGRGSARRVLNRLAGKEQRIIRDLNHLISRRIVDSLQPGDVIVMEDLAHIRERTRVRREQRYIHESWPFAQLQSFIEYKALERGIVVQLVNPRYSSQTCSRCGALSYRQAHLFSCACGFKAHADANAAHNLRRAYLFAPADGLPSISPEATPVTAVAS